MYPNHGDKTFVILVQTFVCCPKYATRKYILTMWIQYNTLDKNYKMFIGLHKSCKINLIPNTSNSVMSNTNRLKRIKEIFRGCELFS